MDTKNPAQLAAQHLISCRWIVDEKELAASLLMYKTPIDLGSVIYSLMDKNWAFGDIRSINELSNACSIYLEALTGDAYQSLSTIKFDNE